MTHQQQRERLLLRRLDAETPSDWREGKERVVHTWGLGGVREKRCKGGQNPSSHWKASSFGSPKEKVKTGRRLLDAVKLQINPEGKEIEGLQVLYRALKNIKKNIKIEKHFGAMTAHRRTKKREIKQRRR